MNTKLSLILLIVVFVFSACKDDTNINNTNNSNDIQVETQDDQLVYPLPTPFEVTQMLQASGTPFNVGITNSVDNAGNYMQEGSQAMNLGVYGADLAYASTFNQAQQIRDILSASKKLSDELGLTNVIDQNIIDRIEQNIENEDSLYKIVNNTFYDTYNNLNQEEKGDVSVLVITGAWIESVYIATQLAISSQSPQLLMNSVAEQKYNVSTILPLMEQYKDNADVAAMIPVMQSFKDVFENVQQDSMGNTTITEVDFNKLIDLSATEREKLVSM